MLSCEGVCKKWRREINIQKLGYHVVEASLPKDENDVCLPSTDLSPAFIIVHVGCATFSLLLHLYSDKTTRLFQCNPVLLGQSYEHPQCHIQAQRPLRSKLR